MQMETERSAIPQREASLAWRRDAPGGATDLPLAYGTRTELLGRLGECIDFARHTVETADPAHPRWKVDLGQVSGYEKMMLEVGLFALLLARTPYYCDEVGALAHALRAKYDSRSALSCIGRHPRLATSLGTLLLVLDRFGLATRQEHEVVYCALSSPYVECSEHVPFRLLDRRWVLGLAGVAPGPLPEALRLSAACRTTHPIYMTREDAYAVTHTVMYATDFGTLPPPMELQGDATWHVVDAAVAWCTAAGDHDLLAELLFTQLLLRRRLSAYGVVAWHRSRDVWDALGFLPSPSLSAETFASLQGVAEQCQYAHNSMYHTVLVGGLVCAALLGAPVTAPDAEPGTGPYEEPTSVNRAVEGAVAHLVRLLGVSPLVAREVIARVEWTADDARVHALAQGWQADHVGAAAPTRMAIDASIILAAQGYDLPQLAAALRHAARTGTATPTVLAGADFLGRQMLVEGAIGAGWLEQGPEPPVGSDTALAAAGATAALANCLGELGIHLSRREEALG